jgi:predicted transcriptional regulator
MPTLRTHRNALGISQSRLARLAAVSRFKICMFELGGGGLTPDEQLRIKQALETESARLRSVAVEIDFHENDIAGDQ